MAAGASWRVGEKKVRVRGRGLNREKKITPASRSTQPRLCADDCMHLSLLQTFRSGISRNRVNSDGPLFPVLREDTSPEWSTKKREKNRADRWVFTVCPNPIFGTACLHAPPLFCIFFACPSRASQKSGLEVRAPALRDRDNDEPRAALRPPRTEPA